MKNENKINAYRIPHDGPTKILKLFYGIPALNLILFLFLVNKYFDLKNVQNGSISCWLKILPCGILVVVGVLSYILVRGAILRMETTFLIEMDGLICISGKGVKNTIPWADFKDVCICCVYSRYESPYPVVRFEKKAEFSDRNKKKFLMDHPLWLDREYIDFHHGNIIIIEYGDRALEDLRNAGLNVNIHESFERWERMQSAK